VTSSVGLMGNDALSNSEIHSGNVEMTVAHH